MTTTETSLAPDATYRPADGIAWAVEAAGVLVIDRWGGRRLELGYPQAAIWDLLARGRTIRKTIDMARFILDIHIEDVAALRREEVSTWLEQGWMVQADPEDQHG